MDLIRLAGFIFVFVFFGLSVIFIALRRRGFGFVLRDIPAFIKIKEAINSSVETGSRLHLSLGSGGIIGMENAPALVGFSMLERVARLASESDKPPLTTSGNASLTILSQDTLNSTYKDMGLTNRTDPVANRITGFTPFSYVAGVMPIVLDEQLSTNILIGHYAGEIALINDASSRKGVLTIAGTDDVAGQAIAFATADEPLIGEELFAGSAYLTPDPLHNASLLAEDVMRWLVVVGILLGIVINIFGMDQLLTSILGR